MREKQPKNKKRIKPLIIGILFLLAIGFYFKNNHPDPRPASGENILTSQAGDIAQRTSEGVVVPYLRENHKLPDYYITKKEAGKKGWTASEGNLCDVLPGRAIGGDTFGNREKLLPSKSNREYFEADLNYSCGRRGSERLVFSNDGLIFITKDHYQTFKKIENR